MSTYTNGHTATAAPPPIAKAQFEINVPMRVQLKFAKGLLYAAANSQFPAAGDQVMFTLADERKLYVPAFVAERMDTLGGQDFIITKKQALASRKITWVVNRSATFDASVHAAVAAIAPAPVVPAYDDGEYNTWGDPPPPPEEGPKTSAVAPPVVSGPLPPTPAPKTSPASPAPQEPAQKSPSRMAAALIAAIDATAEAVVYAKSVGITLKFSEEDIRAVAATIYIQNARNGQ